MWEQIERIASRKRQSSDVVAIAFYRSSLYIGRNSTKTSPKWKRSFLDKKQDSYARHAEMDLLARLPRSTVYQSLHVYVIRWKKDGTISMAKPCWDCRRRLIEAGVKPERIHYVDWNGHWKTMGVLE